MSDYTNMQVCGYKSQNLGSNPSRWPKKAILSWQVVEDVPPFDRETLCAVVANAFKVWSDVCGLRFRRADASDPFPNFEIRTQLEGPGGVLADCELPYPQVIQKRPLQCRIDRADEFVIARNPPSNKVGLDQVLRHEFGHGLGLDHGGAGMMMPVYNPKHWLPSEWEIRLVQDAYGLPLPPVEPTPDRPTASEDRKLAEWLVRSGGLVLRVHNSVQVERFQ
jgi:hypothetical protein